MSGEMLTGQDAPVVANEAQNLQPEQLNTGTTEAQTDGAEGGKESPVPKTYSEQELQERIERATAKAAAKAERRAFREAVKRLQGEQQPVTPPQRAEFADDATYTRAQLEYLAEQRAEQKLNERQRMQEAERRQEVFLEKAEKAAERYSDFHAVVANPNLPINDAMAEFIAESDVGGELAYHLGKNPSKAALIAGMSPIKAARELTRLEGELSKPPATSKAPPPIEPLGTNKTASQKDPTDMSPTEFAKWRKEQIARRGR